MNYSRLRNDIRLSIKPLRFRIPNGNFIILLENLQFFTYRSYVMSGVDDNVENHVLGVIRDVQKSL